MAQTRQRRSPKDRWRRLRRRAVSLSIFLLVTLGLAWFFNSQATTTILFVRHAEVDPPTIGAGNADPSLSARGRARARLLADFVQDVDVVAGIDAVYATKFKRTQQTAAPIAKRLGLKVDIADPHKVTEFMNRVLRKHKGQIVLIVADSDTIAPMIEELHGSKHVKIGPMDYDDLYIVTVPWFAKVKTLRLHYSVGWQDRPPALRDETSSAQVLR
jgi:broad specificity phosphatase PhoE